MERVKEILIRKNNSSKDVNLVFEIGDRLDFATFQAFNVT